MFYSYFELAAALFILIMAFNIFSRHYEDRASRLYAKFAFTGFLAALFEFSMRIAFTLDVARNINRFGGVFWSLTFAIFLHFAIVYTKRQRWLKSPVVIGFIYAPVALLSALFLFTNSLYAYYEIGHIGIVSQPTPLYLLFALQATLSLGAGILLLMYSARKCADPIIKVQSYVIAWGALIPSMIGIYTDMVAPIIDGRRIFPPTCVFDLAIMTFFVYLAMRRYSLFAISPALAADIIVETMPDSLIVTDLGGRVLLLNEKAHKFFRVPKEEIMGKPISALFTDKKHYEKLYNEVAKKGLEIERYEAALCDPLGECIPSFINANKLHDALGATIGVVYVIRDIRG